MLQVVTAQPASVVTLSAQHTLAMRASRGEPSAKPNLGCGWDEVLASRRARPLRGWAREAIEYSTLASEILVGLTGMPRFETQSLAHGRVDAGDS